MTRIKSVYVNVFLFLSVALISIHPVFFPSKLGLTTVFLYIITLALFQYYGEEGVSDKKASRRLVLFVSGTAVISAAQYIFSFFVQSAAGAASVIIAAGGDLILM
ncbi:MAG TPA: hypothetical protein PKZ78_04340 [Candidatus Goldiibacteriota bacterium]|nr:hypothetical protein [Candidatus Goldiibacteriota bacterium]